MIFLLVVGLITAYLFDLLYWRRRNLPPGPTPYPFLGNLAEIHKIEPGYDAYVKWTKEYGPVYTYWMGEYPVVAINDYDLIKESFIREGDKYVDRYETGDILELFKGGYYGVISTDGDLWREQRRFVLHTLRDFGMGKNGMEERVATEVYAVIDRLAKSGKDIDIRRELDIGVGSIINNIVFGYRYDDDTLGEFHVLKDLLNALVKAVGGISFFIAWKIPVLRKMPWFGTAWQQVFASRDAMFGFFREQIEKRRKEVDVDSEGFSDLAGRFIKEQHKRRNEPNFGGYCEMQFVNLVNDIWAAGLETTSNTLSWGFCYILNHPEVQKKLHDELDTVIQSDRKIELSDKNGLPYMNAFICEVQRVANLLPQNLFRKTSEDVVIGGHLIPKGSRILPQISVVLLDERIFPEPEKFKPERFLNADGTLKKVEQFVPFSVGKRQCPGEGLAKTELFLFLANIVQRFEVYSDKMPSMKKGRGVTAQPQPFTCNFRERKHVM